ncbi:uncharacterized protein LOC141561120 isoform X2 [Sminthopsis crassicaudata]|uniref:uncharacterized protein LOC141561120 isoform X2 n=1 Tax=Sminthopsis crassicaudata TaxID=9301 RepID=UPI003D699E97
MNKKIDTAISLANFQERRDTVIQRLDMERTVIWETKALKLIWEFEDLCSTEEIEDGEEKEDIENKSIGYNAFSLFSFLNSRENEFQEQKLMLKTAFEDKIHIFISELKEMCYMEANFTTEEENCDETNNNKKENIMQSSVILAPLWKIGIDAFKNQELIKITILEDKGERFLNELKALCTMKYIEDKFTVQDHIDMESTKKENGSKKPINYDNMSLTSIFETRIIELKEEKLAFRTACQCRAQKFYKEVRQIRDMEHIDMNKISAEESVLYHHLMSHALWGTRTLGKRRKKTKETTKIPKLPSNYSLCGTSQAQISEEMGDKNTESQAVSEVEIHMEREEHSLNEPNITLMDPCNENINADKTMESIPESQISTGFYISTRNCLAELLSYRDNEIQQEKLERHRLLQQRAEKYHTFIETYSEGAIENITKEEENDKNDGTMRNLDQEDDIRLESKDDSNSENDRETATTSEMSHKKKFPRWIPSFDGTLGNRIRKHPKGTKETPKWPMKYTLCGTSRAQILEMEKKNTEQENFPKCQPEISHYMIEKEAMENLTKEEKNDKNDGSMRNLDQEQDIRLESNDDSNPETDHEIATTSERSHKKMFTRWIPPFDGTIGKRMRKHPKGTKKTPKWPMNYTLCGTSGAQIVEMEKKNTEQENVTKHQPETTPSMIENEAMENLTKEEKNDKNDGSMRNLDQEQDIRLESNDDSNPETDHEIATTSERSHKKMFTRWIPSFDGTIGKRMRKHPKGTKKTPKWPMNYTLCGTSGAQIVEMEKKNTEQENVTKHQPETTPSMIENEAMENLTKEEKNDKNDGSMRNLDQEQDIRLESNDDSNPENDHEIATTSERSHKKMFTRWIPSFDGTIGKRMRKHPKGTKKTPKWPMNYTLCGTSGAQIVEMEKKNTEQENVTKHQPETTPSMIEKEAMENLTKEEKNDKNDGSMRNLDQEQDIRLESNDDSNPENDHEIATTSERSHKKMFTRWIPPFDGTIGKRMRKHPKGTKKTPKWPMNYTLCGTSGAQIVEMEKKNTEQENVTKHQPETTPSMIENEAMENLTKEEKNDKNDGSMRNLDQEQDIRLESNDDSNPETDHETATTSERSHKKMFTRWIPPFDGTIGKRMRKHPKGTKKTPKWPMNYTLCGTSGAQIVEMEKKNTEQENVTKHQPETTPSMIENEQENVPKYQPETTPSMIEKEAMENLTKEEKNDKNDGSMRNLDQEQDIRLESNDDSNPENDHEIATTSERSHKKMFTRWIPPFDGTIGKRMRKHPKGTKKTPKWPMNYTLCGTSGAQIVEMEKKNTEQENVTKHQPETTPSMIENEAMENLTKEEKNDKNDGSMRNLDQEQDIRLESNDDSNPENDNEIATTSDRSQKKKFAGWIPSLNGIVGKRIRKCPKCYPKEQENFPKCQRETSHDMIEKGAMENVAKEEKNDKNDGSTRNLDQEQDIKLKSNNDSSPENDNEIATTSDRSQEKKFARWIPFFNGTVGKRIRKHSKSYPKDQENFQKW